MKERNIPMYNIGSTVKFVDPRSGKEEYGRVDLVRFDRQFKEWEYTVLGRDETVYQKFEWALRKVKG